MKLAAGNPIVAFLTFVGEFVLLVMDCGVRIFRRPVEIRETVSQMAFVGILSVPIVAMTTFFSGAVLSLYTSQFLSKYGATVLVGATVSLSVAREIAPVLAGIMIAARCGSAMSAQIATMAVTEQVDALRMLSVHPTNYLVLPRVIASVLMAPVLGLIGSYCGIIGGYLVASSYGVPSGAYVQSVQRYLTTWDLMGGVWKTPVFGLLIAIVACQQGLRTTNGAVGVGRATTNTVVISMVLVYAANFLLATVLFR